MTVPRYASPIITDTQRTRIACVILSEGRSPESKDLRTNYIADVPNVRRSFGSLRSRWMENWEIPPFPPHFAPKSTPKNSCKNS